MTARKTWFVALLVAVVTLATFSLKGAGPEAPKIKEFMRVKLTHSQKVLEGLAVEDFEMIAKHSQQLSLLTLAETWQVIQTPDYLNHSNEFRRAVDSMTKAAEKKNLDGAALAYVQVTLQCINCHKYVRGVRMAKNDVPQRTRRD